MGNYFSTVAESFFPTSRSNKRKIEDIDEDGVDYQAILHVAKKRKLVSTAAYIYKTLFEEGRDSDIVVSALGKNWHLHKIYLCQSPYFESMFSGNWKEAEQDSINIEIMDENIDIDALNLLFGSFYLKDLLIEPTQVIPLLATAVLLQMDSIIEHCTTVITETINVETVVRYHNAARRYGLLGIDRSCKEWLLHNLLTHVIDHPDTLRLISGDLMEELLSSPDLFVMQTEYSIYVLLKTWVFLQLQPLWEKDCDNIHKDSHSYFQERSSSGYFLEEEGREFLEVFSLLRLPHLIYHHVDVEMMFSDRLLPISWLEPAALQQWYHMLRIHEQKDAGPCNLSEEEFDKNCFRCGRVLPSRGQHIWRWTGFNFGFDLIMSHNGPHIKLKRNHIHDNLNLIQSVNRNIMYRVTVASLNEQKQVVYSKTSGMQSISLAKNEEKIVLSLDNDVGYPLLLSVNFMIFTPHYDGLIDNSDLQDNIINI